MMNTTQTSFFIVDCSKGVNTALPRARAGERSGVILHTITAAHESFEQAARRLLRLAELAHGARDDAALEEISQALEAIPFAPAQNAATYYGAIIARRAGDTTRAADLLARLDAPRAIQTLGTIYQAQGDHAQAARLYVEALRRAKDVDALTSVNARIQLSAIKSSASDHTAALADLESLWPMVRAVARRWPHLFFQLHNEIAVERAAVGQVEAARQAVAVAVASPIADAYPEWQATEAELREFERAAVTARKSDVVEDAALSIATKGERRRIARNYFCEACAIIHRPVLAPAAKVLIAGKGERTRSEIIKRVTRCAQVHAPPFISIA